MMLRRLTVSAALVTCGMLAFVPMTSAQTATVTVPFTSVVPGSCTFGTPTGGILGVSTNRIGSDVNGGAAGAVGITCNTNATLTVNVPAPTSTAATTLFQDPNTTCAYGVSGSVNLGTGSVQCTTASPLTTNINSGIVGLLTVGIRLDNFSAPIPAGTYTFDEVLTASPF